jgi:hypothetical protein
MAELNYYYGSKPSVIVKWYGHKVFSTFESNANPHILPWEQRFHKECRNLELTYKPVLRGHLGDQELVTL